MHAPDGRKIVEVRIAADLPATATSIAVPHEFVEAATDPKVGVLTIEASGNQTLTEIAFSTN